MPTQRNKADVFALVTPAMPLEEEYEAGDEIVIQNRYNRLSDHGWVSDGTEDDGVWNAELTEQGAAILNYFSQCQEDGSLGSELERGAGNFVDRAVREMTDHPADWDVMEIDDDHVVVTKGAETREYRAEA